MEVRTGRPVLFAQHTDRFIVENDIMDSYTESESEMSLISRSFLQGEWSSAKEAKGNLEALSKKVNFISEILARPVLRRNTWGNLTTSRLYQQSSEEFGEKICKLKAEDNYVLFSCEGARDTEDRMFVMDSGASMHNGLSSDTPKPNKQLTAAGSSANKRVSTSFCSWSRSFRVSAITRWNASGSIASYALLKTRIFIWMEKRWNSTTGP